jgi:hypothetical protein
MLDCRPETSHGRGGKTPVRASTRRNKMLHAVTTDNEEREFCHHVVRLRSDMTIPELFAEFQRLDQWGKNDEYGDHGECRFERICALIEDVTERRGKCFDDLLLKWKMARQLEDDANEGDPTLIDLFEWRGIAMGADGWSVQAAFSYARTSALVRSILEDLDRLTQDAKS